MAKTAVGIIGCGAIGAELARACLTRMRETVELVAVCDIDETKAAGLAASLGLSAAVGIDEAVERAAIVVEAAGARVAPGILERCVRRRKDCMIMSVGGLLDREDLLADARRAGIRVLVPSGAISGVDGLKAAAAGRIDAVTITTRKPSAGLAGAPYLVERKIDLSAITADTLVFEGTAAEAVRAFPANINVSAVLSLAGIGAARTRVRIIASPSSNRNIHEVEITGDAGTITTRTENIPSRKNPKTSALAIASAIATLEGSVSGVRIGT